MIRAKRDSHERAYKNGYNAGIKGLDDDHCPYETKLEERAYWFDGWRSGRTDFWNGYRTEHDTNEGAH